MSGGAHQNMFAKKIFRMCYFGACVNGGSKHVFFPLCFCERGFGLFVFGCLKDVWIGSEKSL